MRVLYLHQYFNTPFMTGSTRSYEFARRFVAAGNEVHMITSLRNASEHRDWFTTTEAGIHIHWLPVPYSNKLSYPDRIRAFLKFAFLAGRRAVQLGGDVIFATSTPLTVAIPALHAQKKLAVPLVFEVRDLWPEAPRQLGVLTNPVLLWLARRLERNVYKRSVRIVALSPGMQDGIIAAGSAPEKVTVVPNSSDLDLFHPDIDGKEIREKWGVNDRVVFSYFGTMGEANGLDFVLDTAAELKKRGEGRAVFVLHGDGMKRRHLEERCDRESLNNVQFSDPIPEKSQVARIAAASDVCMTIYKNIPVLYTCSPNKMFDSFAAGRSVLTNMPGWLSDLVEQNRCGVSVRPDDSKDFADKVQSLIERRLELPEMGRRARQLAEREFSRDLLAAKVLQVLGNAVEENRQP